MSQDVCQRDFGVDDGRTSSIEELSSELHSAKPAKAKGGWAQTVGALEGKLKRIKHKKTRSCSSTTTDADVHLLRPPRRLITLSLL